MGERRRRKLGLFQIGQDVGAEIGLDVDMLPQQVPMTDREGQESDAQEGRERKRESVFQRDAEAGSGEAGGPVSL